MEKLLFKVKCKDCGRLFETSSRKAKLCPSCRAKTKREVQLIERAQRNKPKSNRGFTPGLPKLSINEVCKLLRQYNKKHGTHYSYGQFVKMIWSGEVDFRL